MGILALGTRHTRVELGVEAEVPVTAEVEGEVEVAVAVDRPTPTQPMMLQPTQLRPHHLIQSTTMDMVSW